MDEKEKAKSEMKIALEHLRAAWIECESAFSNIYVDCNDYILGNEEDGMEYPFHLSFDEMKVTEWVDGAVEKINGDLGGHLEMSANYFEYREMMEKLFCGAALTDNHLNNATEQIRQYLVNNGAGNIVNALGIGVKVIAKESVLLPSEVVYRRFVWLKGARKGEELHRNEIENIGMFLKQGAFYGKFVPVF